MNLKKIYNNLSVYKQNECLHVPRGEYAHMKAHIHLVRTQLNLIVHFSSSRYLPIDGFGYSTNLGLGCHNKSPTVLARLHYYIYCHLYHMLAVTITLQQLTDNSPTKIVLSNVIGSVFLVRIEASRSLIKRTKRSSGWFCKNRVNLQQLFIEIYGFCLSINIHKKL